MKALEELHLVDQSKIIGFDLGDYESISVPQFQYLQEKLKGVRRIQDTTMILQPLRMIKSPRECLCIAANIQNRAFKKFFSSIKKGMSEIELTALMEQSTLYNVAAWDGYSTRMVHND